MPGSEPTPQPDTDGVALRLLVTAADPMTGTVKVEGEDGNTQFSGWVELMGAINAARGLKITGSGDAKPPPSA